MESQSKSSWMSSAGMRCIWKFLVGIMCCWFICAWCPGERGREGEGQVRRRSSSTVTQRFVPGFKQTCKSCPSLCLHVTCHCGSCAAHGGHVWISWRTHHGHALSGVHVEISCRQNSCTTLIKASVAMHR